MVQPCYPIIDPDAVARAIRHASRPVVHHGVGHHAPVHHAVAHPPVFGPPRPVLPADCVRFPGQLPAGPGMAGPGVPGPGIGGSGVSGPSVLAAGGTGGAGAAGSGGAAGVGGSSAGGSAGSTGGLKAAYVAAALTVAATGGVAAVSYIEDTGAYGTVLGNTPAPVVSTSSPAAFRPVAPLSDHMVLAPTDLADNTPTPDMGSGGPGTPATGPKDHAAATDVPEPGSMFMLSFGVAAAALLRRRRA